MVIGCSVEEVSRDKGRNNHSWYTHAQSVEREVMKHIVFVAHSVAGRHYRGRGDMVVEAAMLVVGDQEQALVPVW